MFVAGGTGAIGRHAIRALIRAGHDVTALVRTAQRAAMVTSFGARPSEISMFDRAALTQAFAGQEAIVNLATAVPPVSKFLRKRAWIENDRVRVEGSAAIVDAAIAAGVTRLVQESVVMIYRDHGDAWIGEDWPTEAFPMAVGNLAAERNAKRFSISGGTGVVLRFGWFHGPGATHSEQFLALARRHISVMMGKPDGYVSSIHVADGGAAVLAALDVPAGTYNIVDDEPLTKRDYAEALANAVRKRAWARPPGRLALMLGDRTTSLTRSLRVSNKLFRATAGWLPTHPNAREGLLATAAMLSARGH